LNATNRIEIGHSHYQAIFGKLQAEFMDTNITNDKSQQAAKQDDSFEKAEINRLRENLRRSHKERFLMAILLYKAQRTMKQADY
jgi:hypothetical protein